jgi:hypothetical protein
MATVNIRNAPPKESDWWKVVGESDLCDEVDEYGHECGYEEDGDHPGEIPSITIQKESPPKKFHNCGLETWEQTRKEWNRRTVEVLPPKPTPAEHNQLVRGLTKHSCQRTYELPRRMALSDLIEVYTDIWEGH